MMPLMGSGDLVPIKFWTPDDDRLGLSGRGRVRCYCRERSGLFALRPKPPAKTTGSPSRRATAPGAQEARKPSSVNVHIWGAFNLRCPDTQSTLIVALANWYAQRAQNVVSGDGVEMEVRQRERQDEAL